MYQDRGTAPVDDHQRFEAVEMMLPGEVPQDLREGASCPARVLYGRVDDEPTTWEVVIPVEWVVRHLVQVTGREPRFDQPHNLEHPLGQGLLSEIEARGDHLY